MALAWHVARTNPRAEYLAGTQLESKGFEYYLPVVSTQTARPGRGDAPLFPSYLFLRYDIDSPESIPLRAIPGMAGLVNFGGVAPPVPDDVIERLRQSVANMNENGGTRRRFQTGEQVWVRWGSGETEDLAEVISDGKSPQSRVAVLIEFLGRLVHGEVSRSKIRPASEDEAKKIEDRGRFRRRTRGGRRYVQGIDTRPSHKVRAS